MNKSQTTQTYFTASTLSLRQLEDVSWQVSYFCFMDPLMCYSRIFLCLINCVPPQLLSAPALSCFLSGRFGGRVGALYGHHAVGRDPRCCFCPPAAGCGCHLLLCEQLRPHQVPLRQIRHRNQRTQLRRGQGRVQVSI